LKWDTEDERSKVKTQKSKEQAKMQKYSQSLTDRCYKFSLNLIKFIEKLPYKQTSKIISNQVLRSGTSVGANLVEATASSSRLEFKKFHEIALKSANETKYWLNLLKDSQKADTITVSGLLDEITQLSNMIASGIIKLKGK
jgi:four helix bundle protein